jgi:hypothetical protein
MMPGETILSGAPQVCGPRWVTKNNIEETLLYQDGYEMHPTDDNGRPITVDVLWDVYQSAAGYYIGTFCPHCGPHTRESMYFATKEKAEEVYKVWLQFIVDGKLDYNKMDAAESFFFPGERY